MNTNHSRVAVSLCSLAIITVVLSGCSTQTVQTAPIMAVPVRVAKAVEKTVPIDLTAIGTSEAYAAVSVKSQVNGIIQQVHFTQGDIVKKGELLFTLDARPFQAALEQAQATLARDKAQADLDEVQARRYEAVPGRRCRQGATRHFSGDGWRAGRRRSSGPVRRRGSEASS